MNTSITARELFEQQRERLGLRWAAGKSGDDPPPQLVHVEVAGIDHRIGLAAQWRGQLALAGDRLGQ